MAIFLGCHLIHMERLQSFVFKIHISWPKSIILPEHQFGGRHLWPFCWVWEYLQSWQVYLKQFPCHLLLLSIAWAFTQNITGLHFQTFKIWYECLLRLCSWPSCMYWVLFADLARWSIFIKFSFSYFQDAYPTSWWPQPTISTMSFSLLLVCPKSIRTSRWYLHYQLLQVLDSKASHLAPLILIDRFDQRLFCPTA